MKHANQIILIMTDTQRWDMLGCYADKGLSTPSLDRLAAEGVRFDRAYCCQPVCGPARSALFTGTFPHSNGSWANCMPLGDNVKTIGQRLRDNGVKTSYIGKWHLDGGDYFGMGRCPDGWDADYWYDMRCYLEELTPTQRRQSRRPPSTWYQPVPEEFTFAHRCSDRAIDFLARHREEDFFLVVSYDEPHDPFLCPQEYVRMYEGYQVPRGRNVADTLAGKPRHQQIWAQKTLSDSPGNAAGVEAPNYFGCNTFVDHEIGRVLDAIDRSAPQAMVIYTSDHGDALGSHSIQGKGPAMYDEITRVPLLVRWPGRAPAGVVSAHPASHIDVVPTMLEAFGVPIPRLLEGRCMLRTITDPAARLNDVIFMEFTRYEIDHDDFGGFQPIRAAFDGRCKLVINLLCTDELYDLGADPDEMSNLIDVEAYRPARDALHDRILDWMNDTRDPFRGYYWQGRPWRTDAPQASWSYAGMTRQRENQEYEPRQLDYSTGLEITKAVRKKPSARSDLRC